MTPKGNRYLAYLIALILLAALCMLFPRMLAFVELAARELRYLWWLILIVAFGLWLAFFSKFRK